jgi:sRNA-binding carbon storage regulator CsrA
MSTPELPTTLSPGHLVLRRTTSPGVNSFVLLLADHVDRRAAVGDVLGGGIVVEMLDVEATQEGSPKVHIGIRAPEAIRIERQESFTAAQEPGGSGRPVRFTGEAPAIDTLDEDALEQHLAARRDEVLAREDAIRRLREEIGKGEARGYHHRNNDSHLRWRALKNDLLAQQQQRDRLTAVVADLKSALAARRRTRSAAQAREFYQAFFAVARLTLDPDTLERLTAKARDASD